MRLAAMRHAAPVQEVTTTDQQTNKPTRGRSRHAPQHRGVSRPGKISLARVHECITGLQYSTPRFASLWHDGLISSQLHCFSSSPQSFSLDHAQRITPHPAARAHTHTHTHTTPTYLPDSTPATIRADRSTAHIDAGVVSINTRKFRRC